MSRRLVLLMGVLALAASGCGADVVGPGIPECGDVGPSEPVESATIVQLQAVPRAEWGPCIEELRVGWDYVAQFAEEGRAVFWLDSDRVGDRFVEVELTATCDPRGMEESPGPVPGMNRYTRVDEEPGDLVVAVVGVADRHRGDARALVTRIISRTERRSCCCAAKLRRSFRTTGLSVRNMLPRPALHGIAGYLTPLMGRSPSLRGFLCSER